MPYHPVSADQLLGLLRHAMVGLMRPGRIELSTRQLGVFLVCYLEEGPHTVRSLAAQLHVMRFTITRTLDRLCELLLVQRGPDPNDRRSIVVLRTRAGLRFLADLRDFLLTVSSGCQFRMSFDTARALIRYPAECQSARKRGSDSNSVQCG